MSENRQLLRRYAKEGSEEAFRLLVERYIELVFSTALRHAAGDVFLAQDITQIVFIALARKASSLSRSIMLGGWLHRHTCFVASTILRTNRRRQEREKQAAEMNQEDSRPIWKELAPVLDDAIDRLGSKDRAAIVLRFVERRQLQAVGEALGLSEDAAGKRVNRALEKLRRFLAQKGVVLTASGLAGVLMAETLEAVPLGLASSISATAIQTAGASIGFLTALKLMSTSKLKLSLAGALLAGIISAPIVIEHRLVERLNAENAALRQRMQDGQQPLVPQVSAIAQADRAELDQLRREHRELLRLRGEVGLLRKESQELARRRSQQQAGQVVQEERQPYRPAESWANVGIDSPEAALETFFWAARQRDADLVGRLIRWRKDETIPDVQGLDQLMEPLVPASSRFVSELAGLKLLGQKDEDENTRRIRVEVTSTAGKTEEKEFMFVREEGQWMPLFHAWSPRQGSLQAAFEVPRSPETAPVN